MIVRRAQLVLAATFAAAVLVLLAAFAGGVYAYAASVFDIDVQTGSESGPDAAEHGLAVLRAGLTWTFLVLLVVVPVVGYLLAGRALAPVRAAYDREQRLSDDAAHELRTPSAVLRGVLELAVSRPRSAEDYRAAITSGLEVLDGLDRLTAGLLLLARAGNRAVREDFTAVDLCRVARDAVDRSVRGGDRVRVAVHAVGVVTAPGSPDLLVAAVANLVTNAVAATSARGAVHVAVGTAGSRAVVEVRDDGAGMTPEQVARATERFWRAGTSGPGHGIGLALVREIAELHRGTLRLVSRPGAGTVATLELPPAQARHRRVIDRFLPWLTPRPGRTRRR